MNTVENWLWSVALKKVAYAVAKLLITLLTSIKVEGMLKQHGINVDIPAITIALPATLYGGLEAIHDYLKLKTGISWL